MSIKNKKSRYMKVISTSGYIILKYEFTDTPPLIQSNVIVVYDSMGVIKEAYHLKPGERIIVD